MDLVQEPRCQRSALDTGTSRSARRRPTAPKPHSYPVHEDGSGQRWQFELHTQWFEQRVELLELFEFELVRGGGILRTRER